MKVLLLAPQPFFQLRGTPLAVRRVCEVVGAMGHEIDVLTLHEGEDVDIPGCTIHRVRRPPFVRAISPGFSVSKVVCGVFLLVRAFKMCRTSRYDLVHAIEDGAFVGMVLERVFGVPYVFDMDSSMPEQLIEKFPWLRPLLSPLRWAERSAVRRSAGVLVVCKALEEVAQRALAGSRDSRSASHGAHPIVRVEDVSPVPKGSSTRPTDVPWSTGPVALYVGNLEPYQGVDMLVRAHAQLSSACPELQLVVVGGTAEHVADHRALAASLGSEAKTHFLGPRPLESVGSYLAHADMLVSPRTRGHNTPMKLFSYLESGTPVVATRLPTHTQVVDDQTATLCEATAEAMAKAMESVLEEPRVAQARSRRAELRMASEFSPAVLDAKLRDFYRQVEASINSRTLGTAPAQSVDVPPPVSARGAR